MEVGIHASMRGYMWELLPTTDALRNRSIRHGNGKPEMMIKRGTSVRTEAPVHCCSANHCYKCATVHPFLKLSAQGRPVLVSRNCESLLSGDFVSFQNYLRHELHNKPERLVDRFFGDSHHSAADYMVSNTACGGYSESCSSADHHTQPFPCFTRYLLA